jgi:O-antigen/teichoic acid export membrane protein
MTKTLTETAPPEVSPRSIGPHLVAAGSLYALTNFGLKGFNFLMVPIVSRFLRPADYGIVALVDTIAGPIGMLCGLGTASALRRLYFDYTDEARSRSYVGTALRFVVLTTIAIVALSSYAGPRILNSIAGNLAISVSPLLALAIATNGLGQVQQTQLTIFQVQNQPRTYAATSILSCLAGAIAIAGLVIWLRMGAFGVLASRLVGTVLAVAIGTYITRRFLSAPWNWPSLGEHVRFGLPLAMFELVNLGLVFANRLILQHYRPLDEVGIYAIAYQFGSLMMLVTTSLGQVWSPLFFETARSGDVSQLRKASSALMVGLVAIASAGVLIAQPAIHVILDRRYAAAAPLVPLILGAYLINSFYYLFEVVAMQHKRSALILALTAFACALNIGLNLWCVPLWGATGAAYATLAAYIVQAFVMYLAVRPRAKTFYSRSTMIAALTIFTGALVVSELPLPSHVRPFALLAALAVTMGLLWPLGLNRIHRVITAAIALRSQSPVCDE